RLVPMPGVSQVYITKNGRYAAFTVPFGTSQVSSAAVFDFKLNKVIFCADLVRKPKGAKGPPQLAMESSYFFPSVTEDGTYLVTDGFNGDGTRQVSIIRTSDGYAETVTNAAMPAIAGDMVYFVRQTKDANSVVFRTTGSGQVKTAFEFKERPAALVVLEKKVCLAAGNKIFLLDLNDSRDFKEEIDFSDESRGFEIYSAEAGYSAFIKKAGYVLLAIKKYTKGTYNWELRGFKAE
ncbi:MAG TPA: hypothetical protein P5511_06660, partial [Candidatus Goldiibacteriota bacterium]|nr:hypothetical protein [Candidatus Goldiibacteriota bacterium]